MTNFEDGFKKAIDLMRNKLHGSRSGHIETRLIEVWLNNLERGKWKRYEKKPKKTE
jgi:hypothetical protein